MENQIAPNRKCRLHNNVGLMGLDNDYLNLVDHKIMIKKRFKEVIYTIVM